MALLRLTPSFPIAPVVLASCSALVAAAPLGAATVDAKRSYDLPRGDAATTLRQFAATAGRSLVFVTDKVRGETTNAVRGEFTPREALERMLAGSALEAAQDTATGALVVSRKRTAEAEPRQGEVGPVSDPQPKPPAKPMKTSRTLLAALAGWLAASTNAVDAQTATSAKKEEEAIILSPFVITTDKDNGYQATSTLAGTRLRTDLRDVGTSISVITSQFLQDTGATDTKSLLTYVTGSEVGGLAGNFSGGSPGGAGNSIPSENLGAQASTRLRGLAGASEARNFYNTSIPLDGYNIDRVEVNRGANAILFGTGSPAGIVNSSLKKAVFRDTFLVEARYGSYEAHRSSFDFNKQLLKGELAVRIAGLLKRTQYQQNYAFENDERIYGAVTYDPKWARTKNRSLSGTVLRANIESGNLDSRRPRVFTPQDAFTYWFEPIFPGNPVKLGWDAANARTNSPGVVQLTQANPVFRSPIVWFTNPASSTPGTGSLAANGSEIVLRQGILSNLPSALYPIGTGYFAAPKLVSDLGVDARVTDGNFFLNRSITDTSIFDYRNKLIEGPNRFEYANFEASNVSLEQRFFGDRAGFELAFDKQSFIAGSNQLSFQGQRILIDVNTSLLDGGPNPNYARPFIAGFWQSNYSKSDMRVARATAYYKFDFAEVVSDRWAKWLGKITATGLKEQGKDRFRSLSGSRFGSPDNWSFSNNQQITDGNGGQVAIVSYIGPSLANATTARGANITGQTALLLPTAANGKTFQARAQAVGSSFVTTTGTIIDDGLVPNNFATGASQSGNNIRNQAAIVQYKLLQDHLVITSGWRRDNVDSFTAPSPLRGALRNNLIVNDGTWLLPAKPTTSVSDETQSRSAVLHVPDGWVKKLPVFSSLSLRYNTSQNFRPGGTRFDSNGQALSPPSGTTKDVGFSLGLAENRVVLTATWFTTKQANNTAGGIGGLTQNIVDTWRLVKNMEGLGLNPDLTQIQTPPQGLLDLYSFRATGGTAAFTSRSDVVLTQDAVTQGAEFELFVNLTKSWRVTANVSRTQAVRSNTGRAFFDLLFVRKTNGQTLYENWTSETAKGIFLSEGGEKLDTRTLNNANSFYAQALQDGGPTAELRKWRSNLVTTYSFNRNGPLKGFTIGGGGRWQDKVAIGFPYTNVPGTTTRIPDVQKPFFGPDEFVADGWLKYERRIFKNRVNFSVQLNAFNLLNDDKLIPVGTQPDGSIAVYRVPAERRYELTTRFEF